MTDTGSKHPYHWLIAFIGGALVFAVSSAVTIAFRRETRADGDFVSEVKRIAEHQVLLVYIGSSACGWSNHGEMPQLVQSIREQVTTWAGDHDLGVTTLGVAIDWSIEAGIEHLRRIGPFDEISVGNNWANELARRYFWEDTPGPPATPSILLLRRTMSLADSVKSGFFVIDSDLLVRKVGLIEIQRWVGLGAPIPRVDRSFGR